MPPKLYLIDGHALAYRMFYALTGGAGSSAGWRTSSGEPTAGVYGFARVLLQLLENEKPDYLAVAFDTGKTFRDEMFPEYKATRAKMPDDLRPQIERIRQLVDAFDIPRLELEGYEADDVLGSVARQAAAHGLGVKIITGDRDLLQLVGNHIIVNLPEGGKMGDARDYITEQDVIEKFGVPPHLVVDYKALIGDSSDNIPGVKGIGEKTAQALYQKYTSLDDIYAHLDELPEKTRQKLEQGRAMAYLSRDLARIRTDLPVKLDLEAARADQFDPSRVEALFHALEFKSLLPKLAALKGTHAAPQAAAVSTKSTPSGQLSLFGDLPTPAPVLQIPARGSAPETGIVDTTEKLNRLAETLQRAKIVAFDTETTSTDEMQAELVGISLATEVGKGWYIPIGHLGAKNLPLAQVLAALKGAFTHPDIPKIGHNVKYDYLMLMRHGLKPFPLRFDTMIAQFLIEPGSRVGLKEMARTRLNEEMTPIEALIGTGKNQISMAQVPVEAAAPYAVADAEVCLRLMPQLEAELRRDGLERLMREIEMPLVPVLAEMEWTGVRLDLDFFHQFSKELAARLKVIEAEVFRQVGKPFNLNSTQQLSEVLFVQLQLTPPDRGRKTSSGHYSTAADVLEEMRGQHPVLDLILEHRELSKLKSTYVDALPEAVNPQTGRVHTSYSQTGSVTGRLSSNNPNLQNIPIRTETGQRVRNGFIAEEGKVLLSVDYSQVELRIVAHMAGDEAMLEAFRQGQDIHAATAAAIYGVPLSEVTKEMRRHAKAINFGLIYGMSAFGLTRRTELTLAESERFVKVYFERFPGVKKYLDDTRRLAAEQGYVTTLLGRRRYFPALRNSLNAQMRAREEREAINAPIQGTAADIMKIAMLRIPAALQEAGLHGQMLLQVHDEIVLECPQSELHDTARIVQTTMEQAYPLRIPLSTEARAGKRWGEMTVLDTKQ
ncbi:MAG: DNA polymerase I [Anaerolineales bacterium]|nr:DNA polymerase I [Anaerolineales bacterium]MCX7754329.1 DNA polymerase I [Anaerolineales bacterium]MDW8279068.1 DNA polymerase I [Anaerolineales bacterium]